jgi:hypothetical protein
MDNKELRDRLRALVDLPVPPSPGLRGYRAGVSRVAWLIVLGAAALLTIAAELIDLL